MLRLVLVTPLARKLIQLKSTLKSSPNEQAVLNALWFLESIVLAWGELCGGQSATSSLEQGI